MTLPLQLRFDPNQDYQLDAIESVARLFEGLERRSTEFRLSEEIVPNRLPHEALAEGLDGLTVVKPPYGVIAAIDLNQGGKLLFQVPHGETPDNVRNHPMLRGLDIPKTGQGASVGIMVTKTMLVAGDPQITAPPGRGRGAMLRAYDKKDGHEIGAVLMPAAISGSPMTYSVNGRQFIIVAVSGGNYTGEYIAYALPQSEQIGRASCRERV